MTNNEAFALHMLGLFRDAINNHTGLLRCVAERTDPAATDEVHGNLRDFLAGTCATLQAKLKRAEDDIREHLGGMDRFRELAAEDFHADYKPSCHQWRQSAT